MTPEQPLSYTHICYADDAKPVVLVDEMVALASEDPPVVPPGKLLDLVMPTWTARDVAQSSFDLLILVAWRHNGWHQPVMGLAWICWYADWCVSKHSYHKGRKRVEDVEDLVRRWHDTIVQMSTAHDHSAFTGAEHSTDDLLKPLLSAPIAQIREFATTLAVRLEEDRRVPFLVWSSFRQVVAPLIAKRPEGEVLELQTTLAREVAERVAQDIPREDLVAAIAGALQWRGVEQVKKVKAAVEAGNKPRMTGRQSCLFLVVKDSADKEVAQVIL